MAKLSYSPIPKYSQETNDFTLHTHDPSLELTIIPLAYPLFYIQNFVFRPGGSGFTKPPFGVDHSTWFCKTASGSIAFHVSWPHFYLVFFFFFLSSIHWFYPFIHRELSFFCKLWNIIITFSSQFWNLIHVMHITCHVSFQKGFQFSLLFNIYHQRL